MRTFFITLLLVIVSLSPVFSQPKYEIRATWLTTLGGMDWPRNKAVNASGIRRQQKELCDILSISTATGRNWIKLGKLIPEYTDKRKPYFTKQKGMSKNKSLFANRSNYTKTFLRIS